MNWAGAEQRDFVVAGLDKSPLRQIVAQIKDMGFNSVRLPWSNEMAEKNPLVGDYALLANPDLKGKRALDILDAVVSELAKEGLSVILDNHVSRADWCCNAGDGNDLWYNADYPEDHWIADWKAMAARYRDQDAVIAVDLRNEPRSYAAWGGPTPGLDWASAAERAGNAVLAVNPNLLIVVEGVNYSSDFHGALSRPIRLSIQNRLVYSPHEYSWFHPGVVDYAAYREAVTEYWGFLLDQNSGSLVPLWVSEFGFDITHPEQSSAWFANFERFVHETDLDWAYWCLNGTHSTGSGHVYGSSEDYGILDTTWQEPKSRDFVEVLQSL